MFSTSTIASSTSSPMAMAIPPRVITLIDRSNQSKIRAVVRTESGIAVRVINVVRRLNRNRNRTTMTRTAPSRRASATLAMPRSMKLRCWYIAGSIRTSAGRPGLSSSIARVTSSVSRRVSASGCFSTVSRTPG